MLSFVLKGGLEAGEKLMNRLRIATLGASLGNVDSLIQHPASLTHVSIPPKKKSISDGLVRFSIGIEHLDGILADFDQGLKE